MAGPDSSDAFAQLVALACHDLRTPLATVYGFARTLAGDERLDEGTQLAVGLIEAAAEQMTGLLDRLGLVARIAGGEWTPLVEEAGSLELARSADVRIRVEGKGAGVTTEPVEAARALEALALAALRHGAPGSVTWRAEGARLELGPLPAAAVAVLAGAQPTDLGALVARVVLEALGGTVTATGSALVVELPAT